MRWICLLIITSVTMLFSGCSGDSCGIEGATQECVCTTGSAGSQICQSDGTWAGCICAPAGPAPTDAGVDRSDGAPLDDGMLGEESPADEGHVDSRGAEPNDEDAALDMPTEGDQTADDAPQDLEPDPATDTGVDLGSTDVDEAGDGSDEDTEAELGILHGSLSIENERDIEFLAGFREVTGNVDVEGIAGITKIELPYLEEVGERLLVRHTLDLTEVSLPRFRRVGTLGVDRNRDLSRVEMNSLREVRELSVTNNPALVELRMDALETVDDGGIVVSLNEVLASFHLPLLAHVAEDIFVNGNPLLENVSFPKLTTANTISISSVGELTSVEFPILGSVGGSLTIRMTNMLSFFSFAALSSIERSLYISHNDELTSFAFPLLQTIGDDLYVQTNAELTSLAFPALESVGNILDVRSNPKLTTFALPALRSVYFFLTRANTLLPQCLVDAIVAQVVAADGIGGGTENLDNRDDCTCSEVEGVLEVACED